MDQVIAAGRRDCGIDDGVSDVTDLKQENLKPTPDLGTSRYVQLLTSDVALT